MFTCAYSSLVIIPQLMGEQEQELIRGAYICTHTHTHTCRYCEARRKVVLDHVYEGYDQDFWEYVLN